MFARVLPGRRQRVGPDLRPPCPVPRQGSLPRRQQGRLRVRRRIRVRQQLRHLGEGGGGVLTHRRRGSARCLAGSVWTATEGLQKRCVKWHHVLRNTVPCRLSLTVQGCLLDDQCRGECSYPESVHSSWLCDNETRPWPCRPLRPNDIAVVVLEDVDKHDRHRLVLQCPKGTYRTEHRKL